LAKTRIKAQIPYHTNRYILKSFFPLGSELVLASGAGLVEHVLAVLGLASAM
jgi:hypothetical protein